MPLIQAKKKVILNRNHIMLTILTPIVYFQNPATPRICSQMNQESLMDLILKLKKKLMILESLHLNTAA